MDRSRNALERVSEGRCGGLVAPNERPAFILGLILAGAFVIEILTGGADRWGLSAHALSAGRFETLLTHMFSHAGLWHVVANATALAGFAGCFVARVGRRSAGLLKFALLFLLSGLSGAAAFLLLNPAGDTPMVGASGAVCGFWGASMRLPLDHSEPPRGLLDAVVLRGLRDFAVINVILFLILAALSEGQGGLAWEAHVGGLALGLLGLPLFLRTPTQRQTEPTS